MPSPSSSPGVPEVYGTGGLSASRRRRGSASGAGQLRNTQDTQSDSLVRMASPLRLHFTPTSGSWVNQVERWFGEITGKRIRRGSFKSVPSLEKAIQEYLVYNNEQPRPFVWTADADLILGKIQRLCERICNSPKTSAPPTG